MVIDFDPICRLYVWMERGARNANRKYTCQCTCRVKSRVEPRNDKVLNQIVGPEKATAAEYQNYKVFNRPLVVYLFITEPPL